MAALLIFEKQIANIKKRKLRNSSTASHELADGEMIRMVSFFQK